jgi:hypothetical protein
VQLEFYTAFKTKNLDIVCSLNSSENLKLWWMR